MSMTRQQAWGLLTQYNKEPFHLRHAITVEHVMGWYARELGYGAEADHWALVGLLHDLDFEQWPEEHCVKCRELMRQAGVDEDIIRSAASHGWGICSEIQPEHEMEGQALSTKQALGKMVDRMAADPHHEGRTLAICHCNCLERAFQVKTWVEAKCRFSDILILEAGGITTVYANDGGIVVAY